MPKNKKLTAKAQAKKWIKSLEVKREEASLEQQVKKLQKEANKTFGGTEKSQLLEKEKISKYVTPGKNHIYSMIYRGFDEPPEAGYEVELSLRLSDSLPGVFLALLDYNDPYEDNIPFRGGITAERPFFVSLANDERCETIGLNLVSIGSVNKKICLEGDYRERGVLKGSLLIFL